MVRDLGRFSKGGGKYIVEDANFKCEFLTGSAGTGKTYELKERLAKNKKSLRLCATTGIAAINLSGARKEEAVTTVNSLLGYFDDDSIQDNYANGKLHKAIRIVAASHRAIAIDEVSMLNNVVLDTIARAIQDVNEEEGVIQKGGLGLILTGDFCQLPPVQGDYAFKARRWKWFEGHVTKLEKVWRQTDMQFIEALNAARRGDGKLCAEMLANHPQVTFNSHLISRFKGTTVFSKNAEVDKINGMRLEKLIRDGKHRAFTVKNWRWGKERGEWKNIPYDIDLIEKCRVMILSNEKDEEGKLLYGNGDTGEIVGFNETAGLVGVQLNRNKEIAYVGKVLRQNLVKEMEGKEPPEYIRTKTAFKEYLEDKKQPTVKLKEAYTKYLQELTVKYKVKGEIYFDFEEGKWCIGEVCYLPIRLAYGATVHKTQGLTMEVVQIDMSNRFFGNPHMAYVALSRVRNAKGLCIVGSPKLLEERINIYAEVLPWI